MDILVIAISCIIILAVIATCLGVRYVWTHDTQRRYAGGKIPPKAPDDLNWLPVQTVWQAIDAEE